MSKGKMYFNVSHEPKAFTFPWAVRCLFGELYGIYRDRGTAKRECARYELERLVRLRYAKTGER